MAGDTAGLGVKLLEGASAGADVVSTYTNARAKRGQALYNATMADLEAEDARGVGNTKAAKAEGSADRAVGRVKAQIAGRGFTQGYGTAGDLETAADYAGRLDALTIRENTRKSVLAKRAEAQGFRGQAASISPGGEAMGTLIGQAGLLSRRWRSPDADQ
jgi:hypothetical protein